MHQRACFPPLSWHARFQSRRSVPTAPGLIIWAANRPSGAIIRLGYLRFGAPYAAREGSPEVAPDRRRHLRSHLPGRWWNCCEFGPRRSISSIPRRMKRGPPTEAARTKLCRPFEKLTGGMAFQAERGLTKSRILHLKYDYRRSLSLSFWMAAALLPICLLQKWFRAHLIAVSLLFAHRLRKSTILFTRISAWDRYRPFMLALASPATVAICLSVSRFQPDEPCGLGAGGRCLGEFPAPACGAALHGCQGAVQVTECVRDDVASWTWHAPFR